MNITFLRHGKLLPPFDNYDVLSLSQLSALSLQTVDPPVDLALLDSLIPFDSLLPEYQAIFHSPSLRARQTAQYVADKKKIPLCTESKEIREILFDPADFVTEKIYADVGLQSVRDGLFAALENNTNMETVLMIEKRLQRFFAELQQSGYSSVLVVTHGFLLRIIELLTLKKYKKATAFSAADLASVTNYSYGKGWTVQDAESVFEKGPLW